VWAEYLRSSRWVVVVWCWALREEGREVLSSWKGFDSIPIPISILGEL